MVERFVERGSVVARLCQGEGGGGGDMAMEEWWLTTPYRKEESGGHANFCEIFIRCFLEETRKLFMDLDFFCFLVNKKN